MVSIKMAPEKVIARNEQQMWKNLYAKRSGGKQRKVKLKVGDHVRLNKKYRVSRKGYLLGWTEEVFVVAHVTLGVVPTYKINEWDSTPLIDDLQGGSVKDDTLFRVKKILK